MIKKIHFTTKAKVHFTSKMKVHFMGIGGSGLSGVAYLASRMGYEISGCDLEGSTAYAEHIYKGHDVSHIKNADLVVASPAVYYQSKDNPEFKEAKRLNKLITWQEFLGRYLAYGKKVICIAGTHGKSTTTAMAGKLLIDAGLDPSVVVGAKVTLWKGNSYFGRGDYFVIEADEFFDNFLNYNPEVIILNNIEFDHPDYFPSEEAVFESFRRFIEKLVGKKILIVNSDSQGVERLLKMINLKDIRLIKYSMKFDNPRLNLKVLGRHNISNALGVVELGKILGIKEKIIIKSLRDFEGIERRLQLLGEKGGIKVYDDYAHHPTAIKATITALKEKYPQSNIWAVVEPHGFDRTQALIKLYKNAFQGAYKVIIGPIFKARDKETFGMTPQVVAKASGFPKAFGTHSFEDIKKLILNEVESGDIILVMGAGKSYLWARELLKSI